MRELKFRGKCADTGEWVYGNYFIDLEDFEDGIIWIEHPAIQQRYGDHFKYSHVHSSTVGQYTGLKDKNGTEIYDGDYIRYSARTINGSIFTHVCRVFQHESGTWRIEGYREDNHSYETKGTVYATHLICEVIGNVYENQELAK